MFVFSVCLWSVDLRGTDPNGILLYNSLVLVIIFSTEIGCLK